MTVQIGNTVWDRSTGAITPPGQSVRMERKADGSVKLFASAKPDEATGSIVTTKLVSSEREANKLNVLASALCDSRVSAALHGGIVFAGIRVESVEISIVPHRFRNGEEWLVTGRWTFAPRPDDDGDPRTLYVPQRVETCTAWGDWTERPDLVCTALSDGCGTRGTAAFVQVLDPEEEDAAPLDVAGHYVRVWLPQGTDLAHPTSYVCHWRGKLKTCDVGSNNGRVVVAFSAVDMLDDLDSFLLEWYESTGGDVPLAVDPGEILPFNAGGQGMQSGGTSGDRNGAAVGPFGTFIHDRTIPAGLPWRASHILSLVLAAFRSQFPGGPVWSVGGQTEALDNFMACELDGRPVVEQLAQLIGRGIGVRVDFDADENALLVVHSPLRDALTAGGWTVPANNAQTTLDLSALDDLIGWSMGEDWSRVADRISAALCRPWHCISLGISDVAESLQLWKDYSADESTTWDAADETTRNTTLAHVHRRFRLARTWKGGSYKVPAHELPLVRNLAIDATHGTDGEDGTWAAGGRFVPQAIRFSKSLPFTAGKDWSDPDYQTLDPRDPLERPFVCVVTDPGEGSEAWALLDMEVHVDDQAPVVTIGRDADDAATIKAALAAGKHIVVTVGFLYPLPWRVSWRRAEAERRVDRERSVLYQRPDIDWRYMEASTIVGVTGGEPVLAVAGDIGAKPDTPDQLLGLLRLSHERPFRDLTYTRQGVLDVEVERDPGSLVTAATLPYRGSAGPGTEVDLDAMITQRAYNLDRSAPSTTVSCMRQVADIQISPDPKPNPAGPAAVALAALVYAR